MVTRLWSTSTATVSTPSTLPRALRMLPAHPSHSMSGATKTACMLLSFPWAEPHGYEKTPCGLEKTPCGLEKRYRSFLLKKAAEGGAYLGDQFVLGQWACAFVLAVGAMTSDAGFQVRRQ